MGSLSLRYDGVERKARAEVGLFPRPIGRDLGSWFLKHLYFNPGHAGQGPPVLSILMNLPGVQGNE